MGEYWEIPKRDVRLMDLIATGSYCEVWRGRMRKHSDSTDVLRVAVKKILGMLKYFTFCYHHMSDLIFWINILNQFLINPSLDLNNVQENLIYVNIDCKHTFNMQYIYLHEVYGHKKIRVILYQRIKVHFCFK